MATIDLTERISVDGELDLTVSGLQPQAVATLIARAQSADGVKWSSTTDFQADDQGFIHVATATPRSGGYSEPESNGILWTMAPDELVAGEQSTLSDDLTPFRIDVVCEVQGQPAATAAVTVERIDPNVRREPVTYGGLCGELFLPATDGPFPSVLVLGGSGGGPDNSIAASWQRTATRVSRCRTSVRLGCPRT